jgi:flagellar hook-basal body complex protein FliE
MIEAINPITSGVGATAPAGGIDAVATRRVSPAASTEAAGADFASMLAQFVGGASNAVQTAEATSLAGIRGQASVQQVVDAVMAAEQTLQGAIAIRDKAVAAYLELSRMSI